MSFRAYLDNIQAKTGKTLADFRPMAAEKDFAGPEGIAKGLTATQINDWLKTDLDLGHGHAMAIVALMKGKKD